MGFHTFSELKDVKKCIPSVQVSSRVQSPRSRMGSGRTVRKIGTPKLADRLTVLDQAPFLFDRSNRPVVGGAIRIPAMAQGIAVLSINSRCRAKMVHRRCQTDNKTSQQPQPFFLDVARLIDIILARILKLCDSSGLRQRGSRCR